MILLDKKHKPLEILLVEDNAADAKLTTMALKGFSLPYRLHWVNDGDKALDFLRKRFEYIDADRPDLVFLDWNLPLKNGKEVLEAIRADAELRQITVVVLSVSDLEQDISDAYALGAKFYVAKPMGLDRFALVMGYVGQMLKDREYPLDN